VVGTEFWNNVSLSLVGSVGAADDWGDTGAMEDRGDAGAMEDRGGAGTART
jgi:hypothetical protein